jgi:probable addiction module antidote protein
MRQPVEKQAARAWRARQGIASIFPWQCVEAIGETTLSPIAFAKVQEGVLQRSVMLALRRIASAHGMKDIAETAHLNPKTLYRTLSPSGNPELKSFQAIFGAMGMRLAVTPN